VVPAFRIILKWKPATRTRHHLVLFQPALEHYRSNWLTKGNFLFMWQEMKLGASESDKIRKCRINVELHVWSIRQHTVMIYRTASLYGGVWWASCSGHLIPEKSPFWVVDRRCGSAQSTSGVCDEDKYCTRSLWYTVYAPYYLSSVCETLTG
jgi:hypothetical protein